MAQKYFFVDMCNETSKIKSKELRWFVCWVFSPGDGVFYQSPYFKTSPDPG